jgi:hypothetical protein
VLLVCATYYNIELSIHFDGNKFLIVDVTEKFKRIDDVILLDLSSSEQRAAFFGLSPDRYLAYAIEKAVDIHN